MTTSYRAFLHAEEASQPPSVPPAPWMPLGPLTELWAAFGKEATSREALLAASHAFAALADEREALHNLNWLAPVWPQSCQRTSAADPASFTLLVTQEAIIDALGRAATHWFEAARALFEQAGQPPSSEHAHQAESSERPDLETLIGSTLSQRLRVWAIAHSLLGEQLQRPFPAHEQEGGEAR
ncbi:MAG: hypothetical protein ACRDIV_00325 [Ktedonobacteraceae bacterium]